MLVKASLEVQLDPSCAQPSQSQATTNCGLLVASNTLPWAMHGPHKSLAYSSPSQEAQNQDTK